MKRSGTTFGRRSQASLSRRLRRRSTLRPCWRTGPHRPVAPPDLAGVGYQLLGGRLVPTAHGPAAMFLYESGQGVRLMLFVRPMTVVRSTAIEQVEIGNIDGCAWIDRGVGYSVLAAEPYARLLEVSGHVRQLLRTPGWAVTQGSGKSPPDAWHF